MRLFLLMLFMALYSNAQASELLYCPATVTCTADNECKPDQSTGIQFTSIVHAHGAQKGWVFTLANLHLYNDDGNNGDCYYMHYEPGYKPVANEWRMQYRNLKAVTEGFPTWHKVGAIGVCGVFPLFPSACPVTPM